MSTETPQQQTVLVTGAGGFIGSAIVRELLIAGYRVRGTVRSVSDESKIAHLTRNFPQLELFEADLLLPDSFDAACAGCDAVVHAASPFQLVIQDALKDLIEPAVSGTLNVMQSCRKSGVSRVVLTSSVAAVAGTPPHPEYRFSEADWNTDSTVEGAPYRRSKYLAEKAAWDFAREHGISLTAINPSFVTGAPLSARVDSTSVRFCKEMLEGKLLFALTLGSVALGDVALAHVRALQCPEAVGRRFVVSSVRPFVPSQFVQALIDSGKFKDRPLEALLEQLPGPPSPAPYLLDNEPVQQVLRIQLRDPLESFVEMAQAIIDLGIVQ